MYKCRAIAGRARWLSVVCAALAACTAAAAGSAAADASSEPAQPASTAEHPDLRSTSHARITGTLDHRVKVLSKALDLDAHQQTELWKILDSQRRAVTKIWRDPAMLSSERAPATRAVEDRTAEQIRAMLTDEQKKRYNPPKPQGVRSAPPDVEGWMERQGAHSD